jgi:hypothetical protein
MQPIDGTFVVAFGNKAGSGKSQAANHIHRLYPALTERFAFADAIRMYCGIVHGMTEKDGKLLQDVGQRLRSSNPNVLTREMYRQIREKQPRVALITDLREPDEADFVKQLGGVTVNVVRLDRDGQRYIHPSRDACHINETALDDYAFDYTLTNRATGFVSDFDEDVHALFAQIMRERVL